jgi:hypothetical protein
MTDFEFDPSEYTFNPDEIKPTYSEVEYYLGTMPKELRLNPAAGSEKSWSTRLNCWIIAEAKFKEGGGKKIFFQKGINRSIVEIEVTYSTNRPEPFIEVVGSGSDLRPVLSEKWDKVSEIIDLS